MVRDVAAAICRLKFHIHLSKHPVRCAQVLRLSVAAEGNYVRMFAEEQNIGNRASFASFDEAPLQFKRFSVGNEAPVEYPANFVRRWRHLEQFMRLVVDCQARARN